MERSYASRLLTISFILPVFFALAGGARAQQESVLTISAESQTVTINNTTGILAALTNDAGEPLEGKEITFTADLGTVIPDRAVTDAKGEARVAFVAPDQAGVSHITASSGEVSETIEVTVEEVSLLQWIFNVILCLLGMFGAAGAAVYFRRRARMAKKKE